MGALRIAGTLAGSVVVLGLVACGSSDDGGASPSGGSGGVDAGVGGSAGSSGGASGSKRS